MGAQQRQVHLHGLASARRREGRQNPVDLSNNEDGVGGEQKSLQTHANRLGARPGWDFSRGFVAVDVALKTFGGLSERSLGLVCGGLYCTGVLKDRVATPKAEVLASLPMMLWRILEQFTPLHQKGKERAFD